MSSTAVLAAVPDIAKEYGTTGSIINLSNGLYLLACAFAPCVWAPLTEVSGEKIFSGLI